MASSPSIHLTGIPGTKGAFRAGFTPERVCFSPKVIKAAPTPECFLELTDRPIFAGATWTKSRSGLRAVCKSNLGTAEIRVARLDCGLIRVEYADKLKGDAERRIRLGCLGDNVKTSRPLPTRMILECTKKQAIGLHAMFSEDIDASPEDDYGLTLRMGSTKSVALVLFLARGTTKGEVERLFEKIYLP